ncbi:MAG TPA: head GIN domain-containing protein [Pyrinomonadaceae bacterium]|nr:head GIN domain-containing protein [Pyrinomonadaceae bacterium]
MKKLALLFLLFPLLVAGCHHGMRAEVKGSGNRVVQKRSVTPFTSISTEGAFSIEVTCQKDPGLEVEADDNVLSLITTEVSNNVLRLRSAKNYSSSEPVKFRISVPNLEGLSVEGAGKIDIKDLNNDKFEIDAEGAPAISVSGKTKVIDIDTSGAGKIDTHNLHAARAVVDSKGVAQIDLDVADQLDVKISGASAVYYRGDPKVNKTINGPGRVERRGGEGA